MVFYCRKGETKGSFYSEIVVLRHHSAVLFYRLLEAFHRRETRADWPTDRGKRLGFHCNNYEEEEKEEEVHLTTCVKEQKEE